MSSQFRPSNAVGAFVGMRVVGDCVVFDVTGPGVGQDVAGDGVGLLLGLLLGVPVGVLVGLGVDGDAVGASVFLGPQMICRTLGDWLH